MIIGLTDKPVIRRDGKIRCGTGPKSGGMQNFPHFHMRDCPQLIPVLGETPKDIYFTFHTDTPNDIAKIDLRWYNATEALCMSQHNTMDTSKPIGQWAAYKGTQDVKGVTQEPFPGFARARKRQCGYKECPQYVKGDCGEHLFLNVMVPQYSMSSIFTLDSVSIEAVLNVLGLFEKVGTEFGGKFSGEIYRMYKKKIDSTFFDARSGQTRKSQPLVVAFEHVPYDRYLEMFGDKIPKDSLVALERLRSQNGLRTGSVYAGASLAALRAPALALPDSFEDDGSPSEQQALPAPATAPAPQTDMTAADVQGKTDEAAVLARANNEVLAPLFAELSQMTGVANSEENRIKAAKFIKSVDELVVYLKKRITENKQRLKAQAEAAVAAPATSEADVRDLAPPPATTAPAPDLDAVASPLF